MIKFNLTPSSATRGLDVDLSFEGFEDVLENLDDEPTMKKRVFDFEEEESVEHEAKFHGHMSTYLVQFLPSSFYFLHLRLFILTHKRISLHYKYIEIINVFKVQRNSNYYFNLNSVTNFLKTFTIYLNNYFNHLLMM